MQQEEKERQDGKPEQIEITQVEEQTKLLEQQLEVEERKAEEYLDMLRRLQADFVNYRRRVVQEQAEERKTAQGEVMEQIFPVLDDLGRALEAAPPELAHHPWARGLLLISRRLTAALEQLGVQQFGNLGDHFDPYRHEALVTEADSGEPAGTIVRVLRPGYIMGERVLRPAQVAVAQEQE